MKRSEARGLLEGPLNHLLDPAKRPLIEAFSKGAEIQIFHKPEWDDGGDDVSFTCAAEFYRVKPSPRTIYMIERNNGTYAYRENTREAAEEVAERYNSTAAGTVAHRPYKVVEFVEKL